MEGSTALDVLMTVLYLAVAVTINGLAFKFLVPKHYLTSAYSSRLWYRSFIEYIVICVPFMALILLSSLQVVLNIGIFAVLAVASFVYMKKSSYHSESGRWNLLDLPFILGKETMLTNFRAAVNLATCICILAVDFKIFPEKFSKTLQAGYGLMDVGVGCFVFAHGLNGPETRFISTSFLSALIKGVKSSAPLLFLGLLRLVSVAAIGYHYSVEEYGVHWNFFFTLGFVKIFAPAISALVPIVPPWAKAVFTSGLYQVFLLRSLRPYLLSKGYRDTLIDANREGIFSLLGYLSIYWLAVEVGRYLNIERKTVREWLNVVLVFAAWAFGFWIFLDIVVIFEGPPSRRIADLGYVVWMVSFNLILMAVLLLGDILLLILDRNLIVPESKESGDFIPAHVDRNPTGNDRAGSYLDLTQQFASSTSLPFVRVPYIYKSINYNGLVFFLISNLFTGLVNMSMYTHQASGTVAFIVLNIYVILILVVALTLYLWRLKIKFW